MKRRWKWIGLALASLLVVATFGALAVATQSKSQAHSSLEDAIRLREARLDVARAEKALGGSNIEDAASSGQKANAVALRVGVLTERIIDLLAPLSGSTKKAVDEGRRGIRNSVVARKETEVAAGILGAIAGYQRAAVEDAGLTNKALRRILVALRKTNESIP